MEKITTSDRSGLDRGRASRLREEESGDAWVALKALLLLVGGMAFLSLLIQ